MKAALAIVAATLRQILGTKRLILFGLLALFPVLILYLNFGSSSMSRELDNLVGSAQLHFFLAAPVTALILSAASLGEERRDETLSFIALRPIPRSLIAGAKLGAAFVGAAGLNLVGAAGLGILFGIQTTAYEFILPLAAGSLITTVMYTAVFVPLGYLSERSTLIGLAYVFIWDNGIVRAIQVLGVTSPGRVGMVTFGALKPDTVGPRIEDDVLADLALSAGTSLVQAAVFLALSATLLTWLLSRRDLV